MEFGAASNRVFGIPQCYRLRPSSSSCSVIPSWRVLFDTLGSRLMTHWKYQNRLRSSIGNVGRTPSPLIGLVRPLSGKSRMRAVGQERKFWRGTRPSLVRPTKRTLQSVKERWSNSPGRLIFLQGVLTAC